MKPTVMIVDDHEGFRRTISRMLTEQGLNVVLLERDSDVIDRLRLDAPAVVLVDLGLALAGDFKIVRSIRAQPNPPEVVLISAWQQEDLGDLDSVDGIAGFLSKSAISKEAIFAMVSR